MNDAQDGYITDAARVEQQVVDWLESLGPPLVEYGRQLLARLDPARWSLEWYLPFWLAEPLGVPRLTAGRLVLANVLGLAYVRLQDDLQDRVMPEVDRPVLRQLAGAAYAAALEQLAGAMGTTGPFWPRFEQYMARWQATITAVAPDREFIDYTAADWGALADRAAPLRICCAAMCQLAGRWPLLPQLEAALDHSLVAEVMLDHAADWADDLANGRYNAFVAAVSPGPQIPAGQARHRQALILALALGDGAAPYFELLVDRVDRARRILAPLELPAVERYLEWFQRETVAYQLKMVDQVRKELAAVTKAIFSPASARSAATSP